jgi:hypothetical protein
MGGGRGRPVAPRSGAIHEIDGAAVQEIAATMTGIEAVTFALAAALAVGAAAFRASLSLRAAVAPPTLAAVGFLLALVHRGRWLPG